MAVELDGSCFVDELDAAFELDGAALSDELTAGDDESKELVSCLLETSEEGRVPPTHDERERDRSIIANSLNEVFMIRSFLDTFHIRLTY